MAQGGSDFTEEHPRCVLKQQEEEEATVSNKIKHHFYWQEDEVGIKHTAVV